MKLHNLALYIAGAFAVLCFQTARADLNLVFDQAVYPTTVSGTVVVKVLAVQTPGGPQVGPGNELMTSGIDLAFSNPAGIAAVLALSDFAGGPAFDSFSPLLSSTNAKLGETSVAGISNLTNPLLLGTFTFTGLAFGSTTIQVSAEGPGPSFVTAGSNVLDPAIPAVATINVVPEPATISLTIAGIALTAFSRCRRRLKGHSI
jgi:hypothetical protein